MDQFARQLVPDDLLGHAADLDQGVEINLGINAHLVAKHHQFLGANVAGGLWLSGEWTTAQPADWVLANSQVAINHVALTMPNREAWLKQLKFLQSRGVKFNWRVNHGVTHSVYINDPNGYGVEFLYEVPREMWENDIDGGINWLENLPTEGPEALVDRTDTPSFGQKAAAE